MSKSAKSTRIITDKEIYKIVIQDVLPKAKKFVWIATADIKDLYVKKKNQMVPFLEILSDLLQQGVSVRLIHAKEPGPVFRKDFDKYPCLISDLERLLCPRVHFKSIVIDNEFAFTGSANLTGAGMGSKSENKRNFEAGIFTSDETLINDIARQFDNVWMGLYCDTCRRKEFCGDQSIMGT